MKIFLAGASGYTGVRLVPLLKEHTVVAHLRKNSKKFAEKKEFLESHGVEVLSVELSDIETVADKINGFDVAVSLIGTTRAQFDDKTTYESVDYGTNINLMKIGVILKRRKQ